MVCQDGQKFRPAQGFVLQSALLGGELWMEPLLHYPSRPNHPQ